MSVTKRPHLSQQSTLLPTSTFLFQLREVARDRSRNPIPPWSLSCVLSHSRPRGDHLFQAMKLAASKLGWAHRFSPLRSSHSQELNSRRRALAQRDVVFVILVYSVALLLSEPRYGEAVAWKILRHPSVVPFLGVATKSLRLLSRWMPNGNVTDSVSANPHVDRISLVSVTPGPIVD